MKQATGILMGLWAGTTVLSTAAGSLCIFFPGTAAVWCLWPAAVLAAVLLGRSLWKLLKNPEILIRTEQTLDSVPLQNRDAEYRGEDEQVHREDSRFRLELQLLRRQHAWGQAVLESIRDAVLVVDEQDQVLFANPAARELLNLASGEQPQGFPDGPEPAGRLREKIQRCRNGRIRHVRHELTMEVQGQQRIFEAVLSCLDKSDTTSGGVVAVLHDISREREISQMKNEFVSHVSHELKTPLASINAYAEMLVDGEAKEPEMIRQFCSIIQSQALRLNRLIEDILNISRIESGLIKVNRSCQSMALIVRDAVEMIRSYAQEKNITIRAPAPILYDQVHVDRDMMSQAVINLLSNAVKYTPSGGTITVGLEVDEADGRLTVSVSDTGVGIPPEELGRVFEKFYRVQANNHMAKGTGLGLNLVKQIVETVHGGRVFVSSVVGQGSTFGFELPLVMTGCAAVSAGSPS